MNRLVTAHHPGPSAAKRGLVVLVLLLAAVAATAGGPAAASGVTAQQARVRAGSGALRQHVQVHSADFPFECDLDAEGGLDDYGNLDYWGTGYCPSPTNQRITWDVQYYNGYMGQWYDLNPVSSWDQDYCPSAIYCQSPSDGTYYYVPVNSGVEYQIVVYYYLCADYCDGGYTVIGPFNP